MIEPDDDSNDTEVESDLSISGEGDVDWDEVEELEEYLAEFGF